MRGINGSDSGRTNFKDLHDTLQKVMDKHAPLRKRYVRANQQNIMDKELSQAVMVRSKFRDKYRKSKSEINKYITSRETTVLNYCVLKSRNILSSLISVR